MSSQTIQQNVPTLSACRWPAVMEPAETVLWSMAELPWKSATALLLTLCLVAGWSGLAQNAITAEQTPSSEPPEARQRLAQIPALQEEKARTDRYGDPLPQGVLARLGTVRFRGEARFVAFVSNGKAIAGAGGFGIAYVWDAVTGKELHRLRASGGIGVMADSPKGDRLAVSGGSVSLLETATGKQLQEVGDERRSDVIRALAFSPDGKVLVTGTDSARDPIMAWDAATGKHLRDFKGKPGSVVFLAYSSDGKSVASCGKDKIIRLWDVEAGSERGRLVGHEKDITSLAFADGGKLLVSGSMDETIRVWDAASRKEVCRLAETHGGVKTLAVSQDGRLLACGNADSTIGLWEIGKGQELRHWKADASAITSVAFAPDGKTLVSGSMLACCPRQWDVATGREISVFGGHRSTVNWLAFSPSGKQLYSAACEKTALRWNLRSWREECWFSWSTEHFDHFLLSPDRKTAATLGFEWGGDGVVRLWDTTTAKEQRVLGRVKTGGLGLMTHTAAFSPDDKLLAAGSGDGTVFLWEVATGKERGRWRKLSGCINDLAFSPDGKGLAAATWIPGERTLRYWDVATGKDLCDFESRGRVGYIAFAPDGKLLASVGLDDEWLIRIWDVATGKQILKLDKPDSLIGSLAFSPDSRFLAAGRGSPICVWEVATGQEVCRFGKHSFQCCSLCFSPDGCSLASGGNDSAILLWDLTGRRKGDGLQPAVLTERQLATSWQELAGRDAGRAYRAAWLLASDTERTVPFLRSQWRTLLAADENKIARRIVDLDSEQFAVREQATEELEKQGVAVLPALQRALASGSSAELLRRGKQIREKLDGQLMRLRRMAFVLEQLGSPPARELLTTIASRKLDDRLTDEAHAAVRRLQSSWTIKSQSREP